MSVAVDGNSKETLRIEQDKSLTLQIVKSYHSKTEDDPSSCHENQTRNLVNTYCIWASAPSGIRKYNIHIHTDICSTLYRDRFMLLEAIMHVG